MNQKKSLNRDKNKWKQQKNVTIIAFVIRIVVVCLVLVFLYKQFKKESTDAEQNINETETITAESESDEITDSEQVDEKQSESESEMIDIKTESGDTIKEEQTDTLQDYPFDLDHGLRVEKIGSYTGIYMEDGSDEVVSGVAMIIVTNTGDEYVQYAEVSLTYEKAEATFALSTLFPGESVVVLEKNRVSYSELSGEVDAKTNNVSIFNEIPDLCEDKLEVQVLDGAINISNISDENITGDIVIYYKNCAGDMLYGGITYRVRITRGLKTGEIRQIMSEHFNASGSSILFITCG